MYNGKTVTAVVLAAGSSTRMGLDVNKVYLETGERLIIEYSLHQFNNHCYVDDIIVVVKTQDMDFVKDTVLKTFPAKKHIALIEGGELRCDSVNNAISTLQSDIVIIHDGARPFLQQKFITNCIEAVNSDSGAITAVRNNETLCVADDDNIITHIPEEALYNAQTPQCFCTETLRRCHQSLSDKEKATDDSYLLETMGYNVVITDGSESNVKITTPADIALIKLLMSRLY